MFSKDHRKFWNLHDLLSICLERGDTPARFAHRTPLRHSWLLRNGQNCSVHEILVELDHLKRKETNNSTNLFHITTRYNHQE